MIGKEPIGIVDLCFRLGRPMNMTNEVPSLPTHAIPLSESGKLDIILKKAFPNREEDELLCRSLIVKNVAFCEYLYILL